MQFLMTHQIVCYKIIRKLHPTVIGKAGSGVSECSPKLHPAVHERH